ncbi:MAG: hypothetical protein KIT27_05220 [Legionellales bacterium]|nr:hypothetical protein [Legionellales bacterium]
MAAVNVLPPVPDLTSNYQQAFDAIYKQCADLNTQGSALNGLDNKLKVELTEILARLDPSQNPKINTALSRQRQTILSDCSGLNSIAGYHTRHELDSLNATATKKKKAVERYLNWSLKNTQADMDRALEIIKSKEPKRTEAAKKTIEEQRQSAIDAAQKAYAVQKEKLQKEAADTAIAYCTAFGGLELSEWRWSDTGWDFAFGFRKPIKRWIKTGLSDVADSVRAIPFVERSPIHRIQNEDPENKESAHIEFQNLLKSSTKSTGLQLAVGGQGTTPLWDMLENINAVDYHQAHLLAKGGGTAGGDKSLTLQTKANQNNSYTISCPDFNSSLFGLDKLRASWASRTWLGGEGRIHQYNRDICKYSALLGRVHQPHLQKNPLKPLTVHVDKSTLDGKPLSNEDKIALIIAASNCGYLLDPPLEKLLEKLPETVPGLKEPIKTADFIKNKTIAVRQHQHYHPNKPETLVAAIDQCTLEAPNEQADPVNFAKLADSEQDKVFKEAPAVACAEILLSELISTERQQKLLNSFVDTSHLKVAQIIDFISAGIDFTDPATTQYAQLISSKQAQLIQNLSPNNSRTTDILRALRSETRLQLFYYAHKNKNDALLKQLYTAEPDFARRAEMLMGLQTEGDIKSFSDANSTTDRINILAAKGLRLDALTALINNQSDSPFTKNLAKHLTPEALARIYFVKFNSNHNLDSGKAFFEDFIPFSKTEHKNAKEKIQRFFSALTLLDKTMSHGLLSVVVVSRKKAKKEYAEYFEERFTESLKKPTREMELSAKIDIAQLPDDVFNELSPTTIQNPGITLLKTFYVFDNSSQSLEILLTAYNKNQETAKTIFNTISLNQKLLLLSDFLNENGKITPQIAMQTALFTNLNDSQICDLLREVSKDEYNAPSDTYTQRLAIIGLFHRLNEDRRKAIIQHLHASENVAQILHKTGGHITSKALHKKITEGADGYGADVGTLQHLNQLHADLTANNNNVPTWTDVVNKNELNNWQANNGDKPTVTKLKEIIKKYIDEARESYINAILLAPDEATKAAVITDYENFLTQKAIILEKLNSNDQTNVQDALDAINTIKSHFADDQSLQNCSKSMSHQAADKDHSAATQYLLHAQTFIQGNKTNPQLVAQFLLDFYQIHSEVANGYNVDNNHVDDIASIHNKFKINNSILFTANNELIITTEEMAKILEQLYLIKEKEHDPTKKTQIEARLKEILININANTLATIMANMSNSTAISALYKTYAEDANGLNSQVDGEATFLRTLLTPPNNNVSASWYTQAERNAKIIFKSRDDNSQNAIWNVLVDYHQQNNNALSKRVLKTLFGVLNTSKQQAKTTQNLDLRGNIEHFDVDHSYNENDYNFNNANPDQAASIKASADRILACLSSPDITPERADELIFHTNNWKVAGVGTDDNNAKIDQTPDNYASKKGIPYYIIEHLPFAKMAVAVRTLSNYQKRVLLLNDKMDELYNSGNLATFLINFRQGRDPDNWNITKAMQAQHMLARLYEKWHASPEKILEVLTELANRDDKDSLDTLREMLIAKAPYKLADGDQNREIDINSPILAADQIAKIIEDSKATPARKQEIFGHLPHNGTLRNDVLTALTAKTKAQVLGHPEEELSANNAKKNRS